MEVSGSTRYQLLDEDGDELPGTWEFSWEGRDPFEAVIAAVTEVSGRPWRWSARGASSGRFSPDRCKAMAIRVGKALRKESRAGAAAVIARVVQEEFDLRPRRVVDPAAVLDAMGREAPSAGELMSQPELNAAVMLVRLREALKAAVECDGALRVSWRAD